MRLPIHATESKETRTDSNIVGLSPPAADVDRYAATDEQIGAAYPRSQGEQPQIAAPRAMKVSFRLTPLRCWSGGEGGGVAEALSGAEAVQWSANTAGATYPSDPCGRR